MAKNIYLGANVELSTDSFASFIDKTNLIIDDMGKVVVTAALVAQANTTNGGQTTGNVHIEGVLSSLRMSAIELRGGTMSAPAPLTIGTDLVFDVTNTIDIGTNVKRLANLFASNVVVSLVTSNTVNTQTLNANNAAVNTISANNVSVSGTLSSNNNTMFVANVATSLSANVLLSNTATIQAISANTFNANTANVDVLTSNVMTITTGSIETLSGNTFNFGSGQVVSMNVAQDVRITGNLTVSGITSLAGESAFSVNTSIAEYLTVQQLATFNGNTVIGVDGTKTLTINAALASNIILASNNSISVGSTTKRLGVIYTDRILASNVSATSVSGNGSGLTALNGSQITTGTIAKERMPSELNATIFGENVTARTGATGINGSSALNTGTADKAGFVEFRQKNGERAAFIGYADITDKLVNYYAEAGYRHSFTSADSALTPLINGQVIWYQGNDGAGSGLDADLVDGMEPSAFPVSTPQQTALNLKANLASPAFTGTPTAPTQAQGNNSTRLATTAYVDAMGAGTLNPSSLNVTGAAGTERVLSWRTNGVTRWALYATANAEGGTATGSNLAISRYNNSGTYIDAPLIIDRSNGNVSINNLSVVGNILVGTSGAYLGTDGNIAFTGAMTNQGGSLNEALNRKANLANPTFTGVVSLPGVSANEFKQGNADGASYSQYNIAMKGWWGMGMQDHTNTVNGYYDFRSGKWDTKGGSYRNGVEYVLPNGGNYNLIASKLKEGGSSRGMTFNWNGQSGQPDWLWGGSDGTNMYVYNPGNFSVANSAQLGGVAASSYATKSYVETNVPPSLGVGQTWQNMLAQRTFQVTYQNTTGRAIVISVTVVTSNNGARLHVSPDNVNWVIISDHQFQGRYTTSQVIPSGYYYRFTPVDGNFSSGPQYWAELR